MTASWQRSPHNNKENSTPANGEQLAFELDAALELGSYLYMLYRDADALQRARTALSGHRPSSRQGSPNPPERHRGARATRNGTTFLRKRLMQRLFDESKAELRRRRRGGGSSVLARRSLRAFSVAREERAIQPRFGYVVDGPWLPAQESEARPVEGEDHA